MCQRCVEQLIANRVAVLVRVCQFGNFEYGEKLVGFEL